MTVKEIAKLTGKTDRAVRNWIVNAGENISSIEEKNSAKQDVIKVEGIEQLKEGVI